ncbi:BppU family phage baseplate upper protein [Listeria cornellensis]|uniref:Phage protein XkdV n=1 Tax=Listeria cornellensis FSL F6-0969 TaxID=1265820 RepID=W7CA74_9LIST|nr:BppU family phage baseplate upper protein [Listeria cornellensis]EUJ29598.1 phage protein XkdV [Listeria cornellensis FSL F6-0969]
MAINEIYKDLGTDLEISSLHQNSIDLKGSFSTQDIKTARLIFDIEKNDIPLPMSSLSATIYMKGSGFVVQDICQVNKEMSQITYIIDSETIKHYGSVQAEIYLRYNQGQSLSVHKFHFRINQALIDQDIEVIYQVYIRDLEDVKAEYIANFENLDTELRQMLEELRVEITALEDDSGSLSAKLTLLEKTLIAMDALKKSGDVATGTLNSTAESAFNVSCGGLRHYIGLQQAGTIVRIQIGTSATKWGKYVDVIVGGTEIIADGDLRINPISTTTTYATGIAPLSATWTKSIINGVEKPASNTVTMKNLMEFGRNGDKPYIRGNVEVDGSLTLDVSKINSAMYFDASNVTENMSWARGAGVRSGDRLAEMGISGVGKTINSAYIGVGASPYLKANGLFIDFRTKIMSLFGIDIETVLGSQAKIDKLKKDFNTPITPLTLKNGFTAQNNSTVGYLAIPLGNRYLIWVVGWISGNSGLFATMPTLFLPDAIWQTAFTGAQQSSVASNQTNLYINPVNGNMEVVAIGSTTVNVALHTMMYLTKEVIV